MNITDIREKSILISRYEDPVLPTGGLTTSLVAVTTDVVRNGKPVIGYGYSSVGRFAQGGLIRERFAARLLRAPKGSLADEEGTNLDPFLAWNTMMNGEKPGGHGERCVAVGTLDMAIWDAAAKIADLPLYDFLAQRLASAPQRRVRVYAGGGYRYPCNDLVRLSDELRRCVDLGFTHVKIKVGGAGLDVDCMRIEAAASRLSGTDCLAVDAMNLYDQNTALQAAAKLAPYKLWWFEDICDPLDFATHARVAKVYASSVAAGEALFSQAEARLLVQYGGLRSERDVLVFDPVHSYGVPGYLRILETMTANGWPRRAFWPHGGHLFALHLVAALDLGGAEISPFAFSPFRGLPNGSIIENGRLTVPQVAGIGFEIHAEAWDVFRRVFM